jgi:hypothetical protein
LFLGNLAWALMNLQASPHALAIEVSKKNIEENGLDDPHGVVDDPHGVVGVIRVNPHWWMGRISSAGGLNPSALSLTS